MIVRNNSENTIAVPVDGEVYQFAEGDELDVPFAVAVRVVTAEGVDGRLEMVEG